MLNQITLDIKMFAKLLLPVNKDHDAVCLLVAVLYNNSGLCHRLALEVVETQVGCESAHSVTSTIFVEKRPQMLRSKVISEQIRLQEKIKKVLTDQQSMWYLLHRWLNIAIE